MKTCIEDLKAIYQNNSNDFDIIDILDNDSDLFELNAYIYRKASSNNEVYHTLDLNNINALTRKKLKLDIITTGANAEGMDFLEIGNNTSIAFESKRYEEQNIHKGVSHKEVANKNSVVQNTNIDKLIFVTNKTKASFRAEKYNPDVGYIFRDEIFSHTTLDTVRNYLKNHKKKKYFALTPRDQFFEEAITDCGVQITIYKDNKERIKIFQHWPASTGKGSMPRIIYDRYIEPQWNFKKSYPINAIVNPNTTILKTNLMKQVEHDLALNNNVRHLVFGDATKGADMEDLSTLQHLCDVVKNEKHFYDLIKQYKNSTIWIHVTNDSYKKVALFLKAMKKSIFFSHLDEVHHNIQPIDASWRAPLNDSIIKVKFCYMTSANIRIAKGKGAVESMDDDDFADIYIKDLDEQTAVKLGYKRQTRQLVYEYDHTSYPVEWVKEIEDGKLPNVKFDKVTVPLHWAEQLDANIRAYIEHDITYMKYTFNRVNDIIEFKKNYQILKEQILRNLAKSGVISSNTSVYRKILKRPFIVADTHSFRTTDILRKVEAIPDVYPDGADFGHVFLLGEGWDPEKGWVESNCFMDPTHSELRIYQDVNRGARGPQYRTYNDLVVAVHKNDNEDDESYRNRICSTVIDVGEKLQHGFEDIRDSVIFKAVRGISTPGGAKVRGRDFLTHYDESGTDILTNAFNNYVAFGKHYNLFQKSNEILDYYQSEYEKQNLCFGHGRLQKQQKLEKEILEKWPETFEINTRARKKIKNPKLSVRRLLLGHSFKLSSERKIQVFDWRESQVKLAEKQKQKVIEIFEDHVSKQFYPNSNFSTYREDILNLDFIDSSLYTKSTSFSVDNIIVTAYGSLNMKDIYDKYKDNYPVTQKKVANAIMDFFKENNTERLIFYVGCRQIDRINGTWGLTSENILGNFVKQKTGLNLTSSTLRGIITNTGNTGKFGILNEQQLSYLKNIDNKVKKITNEKGNQIGLLKENEVFVTPAGKYTDILQAVKDNDIRKPFHINIGPEGSRNSKTKVVMILGTGRGKNQGRYSQKRLGRAMSQVMEFYPDDFYIESLTTN